MMNWWCSYRIRREGCGWKDTRLLFQVELKPICINVIVNRICNYIWKRVFCNFGRKSETSSKMVAIKLNLRISLEIRIFHQNSKFSLWNAVANIICAYIKNEHALNESKKWRFLHFPIQWKVEESSNSILAFLFGMQLLWLLRHEIWWNMRWALLCYKMFVMFFPWAKKKWGIQI